ncbi:MAG: hypothetical protein WBJ45_08085 [Limnohabitans sp.]|uniref:hypothetical protein n=1 Tax=Limnohabitans sp. TaxID=1907725 RepID=UPI003BB0A8E3
MKALKSLYVILFATLLAACATPQERAARAIERHGPYCEGLGYSRGTESFINCVRQEQARVEYLVNSYQQPVQVKVKK